MKQVVDDQKKDNKKGIDDEITIRLSYDITSPWSYLALAVLKRYKSIWNFDLVLNPIWLGGVVSLAKSVPPFKIPNKCKLMAEELPLMAMFFGVEYHPIKTFPVNTLKVMRLLRVIRIYKPEKLDACTDRLFKATFVDKISPGDFDIIVKALSSNQASSSFSNVRPSKSEKAVIFNESELKNLMAKAESDENKVGLKEDTEKLVNQEFCFGFPWIQVFVRNRNSNSGDKDNEEQVRKLSIFGSDRFEFLANWLGKKWYGPNPQIEPLFSETSNKIHESKL
ncbi:thioredoxin-like protein [Phakopsora pachyrhizi]|uniref:Thioredoxin-like protein n=1 Tax=Phakopsora pachyrhizi TaxID=170000 RepID=A0AAV0BI79_PHAPC|nr:thioredoxin-like protein [Phakopsora pachyrhizi]